MTDKPFPKALQELLDEKEWSNRELSRRCQEESPTGWGTSITINRLVNGEYKPPMSAIEIIAGVFRIKPDYFAEYRLGLARAQLDPEEVGLRVALKNLERFDR